MYQIAVAVALGVAVGHLLGALVLRVTERGLIDPQMETFIALAASFLAYGAVQTVGGLGFLAVFCAGIAFRRYEGENEYHAAVHRGAQRVERLMTVVVIVLLGSVLTLGSMRSPGVVGWLLAACLIVAIRPLTSLPALVLDRSLGRRGRVFVAWFGVRGVAAIYYATTIVGSGVLGSAETRRVFWTVIAVVITSVVVHGTTAAPFGELASEN